MTTPTERGTFRQNEDGRPTVLFERIYDLPIDRVWALVSDPAELAHWFPFPEVTLDLVMGGAATFSGDRNAPGAVVAGRVTALDPPRLLAYDWGGDELRFELTRLDGARTRLSFTDFLEAEDAAARNAAGWDLCLAALGARAAGAPAPPRGGEGAWQEHYDAYVAEGLPSGAVVPDRG
ncbi:SRPBCC domain-containing protein [Actinacidiphila yeochonensis]|uniref:SRPBCC domain-containing protein n=1 Tax=Actinacidiphila yeochonensis TaxID=89050 RepID=UPI0005633386|nr:SRPBCC domain-containing protein [Actinacidiphila yeochonensis]